MICERCLQNPATVHVTELAEDAVFGSEGKSHGVAEQHLCNACAGESDLPHQQLSLKKSPKEIWNLLQVSARRARSGANRACPECKTTLLDFRQKGRLGCPRCYEVFAEHLEDLLERIHGATEHIGRVPGIDPETVSRMQKKSELERALDEAIREEAYESAARIRDELNALEKTGADVSPGQSS